MEKLKEKLWKELDEISDKPDLSAGDLETAHKLTDTIKNIDKICMLEEDGGYSHDGEWTADMRGSYGRGSSYANRRRHLVRSHYSRDGRDGDMDGYSSRHRDSRGRYSREDGRSEMMEHLEAAYDAATPEMREDIKRFMRKVENV